MQNDTTSTGDTYIPRFRLETHAQVEQRIGRSRATLCAMRDPKDRRYDPTFPKPIPVGPPSNPYASIRFDASEIDEWVKSRIDMRSDKKTSSPHQRDQLSYVRSFGRAPAPPPQIPAGAGAKTPPLFRCLHGKADWPIEGVGYK